MPIQGDIEGAIDSYQPAPDRDIGWAVRTMRSPYGDKVRRAGWNGKGMYVQLREPDANSRMTEPYVYMKTAQGGLIPWLCSQADLLATDWEVATD